MTGMLDLLPASAYF